MNVRGPRSTSSVLQSACTTQGCYQTFPGVSLGLAFLLVNLDTKVIGTFKERESEHAGNHKIQVEGQGAINEHCRKIAKKRQREWRCNHSDDYGQNSARHLNHEDHPKGFEVSHTHPTN